MKDYLIYYIKNIVFSSLVFIGIVFGSFNSFSVSGQYCTPSATTTSKYINNFSTTGGTQNITNNGSGSSTGGYGDFTYLVVEQEQSGSVNFSSSIAGGAAGFRIWVDWNQDGVDRKSVV